VSAPKKDQKERPKRKTKKKDQKERPKRKTKKKDQKERPKRRSTGRRRNRQKHYYSGKKKKRSFKVQVVVENGKILSTSFANRNKHDFRVLKESQIPLQESTLIEVDLGIRG